MLLPAPLPRLLLEEPPPKELLAAKLPVLLPLFPLLMTFPCGMPYESGADCAELPAWLPKDEEDEDEVKKGLLLFEEESEFVLEAKEFVVLPPIFEEVLPEDVKPLPEFVLPKPLPELELGEELKPLEVLTKPLAPFEDEDEMTFPWGMP